MGKKRRNRSTWNSSTLILLFSEMLKFPKNISTEVLAHWTWIWQQFTNSWFPFDEKDCTNTEPTSHHTYETTHPFKTNFFWEWSKEVCNPKGQGVLRNVEAKLPEQHLELKILGCHSLEQGCSLAPHMNMHNWEQLSMTMLQDCVLLLWLWCMSSSCKKALGT
jgi:hypothetical protein